MREHDTFCRCDECDTGWDDERTERLFMAIFTDPDSIDGDLPELTAEERAAMDALPSDFIDKLLRGERVL